MQTVPLQWVEATLAVPPISSNYSYSSDYVVGITKDSISFIKVFYCHEHNKFYDTDLHVQNVTHWAKVILPKSKKYNDLKFDFINDN